MEHKHYIDELLAYAAKKKAEGTYRKCIRAKKYRLATKIAWKYNIESCPNDSVIAFGFALMANK
jgi:hypothetical protein